MNANQIGIRISTNGGALEQRFDNMEMHEVKSLAGTEFQKPFVKTVCDFDMQGVARLFLKKTVDGVVREER